MSHRVAMGEMMSSNNALSQSQFLRLLMLSLTEMMCTVPLAIWTIYHNATAAPPGHWTSWDDVHYDGDVESFEFLAFYLQAGKVTAVLSCGRNAETALLAERMRAPLTLDEALAAIA